MKAIFQYFTTDYLGTVGTLLFHGALLILFLVMGLETPEIKQGAKKGSNAVELNVLEDIELEVETDALTNQETTPPPSPQDVKYAVVDESDKRERSSTDYSTYNRDQIDQEIEANLRNLEQGIIKDRRESGKTLKTFDDKGNEVKSDNNEDGGKENNTGGSGKTFGGTATVSFYLPGRQPRKAMRVPAWKCKDGGTVVINIEVDVYGAITKAEVNLSASTTNTCLHEYARTYALGEKFNRDESKPKKESGTITYRFVAQ